ncbi:condensation domain-containing protein [Mycolicibacterium vaccae]|uniref:condensation domain-containing protein n=1 Tax=Mycolicibacterium vaccae TaxID=1810 RepID=UPI003D075D05
MFELTPIHEWADEPGVHVSWGPSAATASKAKEAPRSDVPVSYQQAQHVRSFLEHTARGTQMARLTVPVWNIQGRCDIRAMTHVINAYLRRHDTYRSRFEVDTDGSVVRHALAKPSDIRFTAVDHGEQTVDQWRAEILATPGPVEWDCFRFGIIQRADHFTFYMCVDHVHVDAMFLALLFVEIHLMYAAIVDGGCPIPLPPAGSYDEYCIRQREFTSKLTTGSPEVQEWIAYAKRNGNSLPRFPLPLGDFEVPCEGDLLTVELMDERLSDEFEKVCAAAGARFIGGVFACAAMAEHSLTGSSMYHTITPTSTRRGTEELMTTGWFTGTVPITVTVNADSLGDTLRSAQASFDNGLALSHVPFDRVVELAGPTHGVKYPGSGVPMISYLDTSCGPFSPDVVAQWNALGGRIYSEAGAAHQVGMWVNRFGNGTSVTVAYPNNPVARDSVIRYVEAMKAMFVRVAASRHAVTPAPSLIST